MVARYEGDLAGPAVKCLRDDSTGNLFEFDSMTGAYQFTRCTDNFTLSGAGTIRLANGILTLTDFEADRRLNAGLLTGQLTGSATILFKNAPGVWQTFSIHDTVPNAVCSCGGG